ncbi:single-stranded DNA-binding protein [Romboutsia maritimum]|uniref:Single-stranded DNA-binding protein n=1 Tax=Romboutsia maritimum TaxID=2020948 RepID=A0A371IQU4_9FIRM|nr:single-stranded DNA-binding protein [Romboutsia maritimum]RDY22859.1 single-stranded DNA-binding protein [Romboutsia maritimum]
MNHVVLIGRLTRDPELKYLAGSGTAVANFAIAVDREFTKDNKKETDFIDIQVWGKTAENCANYLGKGSMCAVQGSLRIETYEKDGEKRKATKINANRVQFLDSKNKSEGNNELKFVPNFEPTGNLNNNEWDAISEDSIPF